MAWIDRQEPPEVTSPSLTEEIVDCLEVALEALSAAHAAAKEGERHLHAQAINDAMRIVEDLRQRNEEYNPNTGVDPFPAAIINAQGVWRAVRVAVAFDRSRAIYRLIEGVTHRNTREYIVWAPDVDGFRRSAEPVNVALMADAALYQFED